MIVARLCGEEVEQEPEAEIGDDHEARIVMDHNGRVERDQIDETNIADLDARQCLQDHADRIGPVPNAQGQGMNVKPHRPASLRVVVRVFVAGTARKPANAYMQDRDAEADQQSQDEQNIKQGDASAANGIETAHGGK